MQIITGKYRARKLDGVPSAETRPTLTRVKENIFNMISDNVSGAVVLDLFAGSGAYGIECISRGAEKVYFVDKSVLSCKTIKKNTQNMTEDFEILNQDYLTALENFSKRNIKFDIVFLDPPYKSDCLQKSLDKLAELNLISSGGLIIVEQERENNLQNLSLCYIIKKEKKYGIAHITLLEAKG